ncbi:hypothetical protein EDD85DRAFT_992277 [Armillaria nabsnona]|nr:hypothetical protein EDD85DRAFT_992277 [Armillaria nabsnona]
MSSSFSADIDPALLSLGPTMGAMFIGETIALILYGTSNLQTAIYFKEYPKDWWFYRLSIAVLWVLDTLHIAFTTHSIYFYAINSFGDYLALLQLVWSFKLALLLYNMIVLCVHIVYCLTIEAGLITTATVDIIISFAMSYYLLKGRTASTNFFSTNIKLEALMRLVLISGLGTSALVIASLITFLVLPGTLIFLSIGLVVPKLYINSLLAMFNARGRRVQETLGSVSSSPTSRVQGDENMTGTVPLTIISGVTSDDLIVNNSKSQQQFHSYASV